MNSLRKYRRGDRQRGAAMVEMAIVVSLFLALVFGIIEFALIMFHWSRLVEATRAGARYAIVNEPACSIYDDTNDVNYKCDGGPLVCDDEDPNYNNEEVVVVNGACTESGDPLHDAGCKIVKRMRAIQPLIDSPDVDVRITYTCTDAGFAGLVQKIPAVTVGTCDEDDDCNPLEYNLIVPGLLGLEPTITMPAFATTRTGEDLDTID